MNHRPYLLLVAALFCAVGVAAQKMKWNAAYQAYIDQYKDVAIEQMLKYDVPASITLAQGLLESGAGRSELTRRSNNHFGIKCHGWTGKKTYHNDDRAGECFRVYKSAYESFEDHSKFLREGRRYADLFKLKRTDFKGWAKGLRKAGYATDPDYPTLLIGLIQLYKLYQYDDASSYDKFIAKHTRKNFTGERHQIHKYNKNYYVVARAGDSLADIADEMGIKIKKLVKYNEMLDEDMAVNVGDIIYLKKKQKYAAKDYKGRSHYVRAGETMHSISQQYGMQMRKLYKLNHLKPDYQLCVGDELKLR
ncbi:MAG: glucosaminidase domain-containing protein [Prevotella sp.]|nr:glucosaminidase domain-containing protein [Prevotella sp.]